MTRLRRDQNVELSKDITTYINLDDVLEFIDECNTSERNRIARACGEYGTTFGANNLYDQQKAQILTKAFDKYNLFELERILPNCK